MEELSVTCLLLRNSGCCQGAFYISFARWEPHRGKGFHLFLFLFAVAPIMPLRSVLAHGGGQQRV